MQVIDCFIITGIGILTVFAVLFVLSIIIRFVSFSVHATGPSNSRIKIPFSKKEPIHVCSQPQTSFGLYKQYDVDDDTAAMVMAIVADEMQVPLNEITFISIREVNEREEPK